MACRSYGVYGRRQIDGRIAQKVFLPCSAGSQVTRHRLTFPARTRPSFVLLAFTDRPSQIAGGVLEVSRFSCMLFLTVPRFFDYAGPGQSLAK
jgi:hypothetical protein